MPQGQSPEERQWRQLKQQLEQEQRARDQTLTEAQDHRRGLQRAEEKLRGQEDTIRRMEAEIRRLESAGGWR
jgi:alkyl sulfatase BDS1-like metallo-beta-lactamase superfamily hydrolase